MAKKVKPGTGASRKQANEPEPLNLRPWLATLAWCGVLLLLVWGGIKVAGYLDRPITEVRIGGELSWVDVDAVREQVLANLDDGVLTTELRQVHALVMSQPWVRRASIRRQWPGVLVVHLVERTAVARWGDDALLTAEGEIFKPGDLSPWSELPQLSGVDSAVLDVMRHFDQLQSEFAAMGLELAALHKEPRGAWRAKLAQGGIEVHLGRQDLQQKLTRFGAIYRRALEQKLPEIAVIDLRYTNGLAVRYQHEKDAG